MIKTFVNFVRKTLSPGADWARRPAVGSDYNGASVKDSVWIMGGIEDIAMSFSSRPILFRNSSGALVSEDKVSKDNSALVRLLRSPNPLYTGRQFLEKTSMVYDIGGSAFWVLMDSVGGLIRDMFEKPAMMQIVGPNLMQPRYANDNATLIGWWYSKPNGTRVPVDFWQVVRFFKTNPSSDVCGLSMMDKIGSTLELDKGAKNANKRFFRNGARPSGVIHEKTGGSDPRSLELLRDSFESGFSSSDNFGKTPVIPKGFEWKSEESIKDMDFEKLSRMNRDEMFGATRVPKHHLGVNDDLNYATAEVTDRAFWTSVVQPRAIQFADVINSTLFAGSGLKIEFDFTGIPVLENAWIDSLDKRARLATRLYRLGYPINTIEKVLDLGLGPIAKPWANAPHDPLLEIGTEPPGVSDNGKELSSPFDIALKEIPDLMRKASFDTDLEAATNGDENAMERVIATIEKNSIGKLIPKFEKFFSKYVADLGKSQVDRINAYLAGEDYRKKEDAKIPESEIESILFDTTKWDTLLVAGTKPLQSDAFFNSVRQVGNELGGFSKFKLSDLRAAMEVEAINAPIVGINKRLRDRMRSEMQKIIASGGSNKELIESVQREIDVELTRARTVARTELGFAQGRARYLAIREEVGTKQWLSSKDENVRSSHKQYASLGSKHMNYAYATNLHYPHEIGAAAGEVVNCRCVIVSGKKK